MEKGRRWRSRTAEGLTIVVSILLALLADAAWGYRTDRVDERHLLEDLQAEFDVAADEISNDINARAHILAQTEVLLAARLAGGIRVEADSLQSVVFGLQDWRFYTPVHAVLQDAIESGRLGLIRSDTVRESLMAYLQARDRLPVFEGLERDFVTTRLEPYLGELVSLDVVMTDNIETELLEREADRFRALAVADGFGSLLYSRRDRSDEAQRYSYIVQRRIEDVLAALAGAS